MILDGLLLGFCLWLSYFLRTSGWVRLEQLTSPIPPFPNFYWMLALIVPVSPLLLDLQEAMASAADDKSRAVVMRRLRRALAAE